MAFLDCHPTALPLPTQIPQFCLEDDKPLKCRAFTTSVQQALLAVAWLELSSTGTALELGLPPQLVLLACLTLQSSLWDDGQAMLFRAIFALTQKTFWCGKPNGI